VNKEDYRVMKEINSLYLENLGLEKKVLSETSRIDKVYLLRSEAQEQIVSYNENLKSQKANFQISENDIAKLQNSLDNNRGHLASAITEQEIKSLESQITTSETKLDEAENSGLELMESIETLEKNIKTRESFLQGSQETLIELSSEVAEITKPHRLKTQQNTNRLELLKVELPELALDKYLKLLIKNLKYGPLASIDVNQCSICKYGLAVTDIELIEKKLALRSCAGCSRLFVPRSTLY
jgi:predicted  nucleic acid-binding Zn-ribbon protein